MNKKLILSLGMVAFSVLTFASCKAKHNHTFGDSFQHDSNQHWKVCEKDGCNEVSGKEDHHGGTATCTELAKCEDCGVSYGSTLSHSFTESKVDEKYLVSAADCDSSAVYYKSCVCGEKGTETFTSGEALGHSYATTYEKDATHHWSVCTREGCTATSEKVAHSGGTATETTKAVCSTCGEAYGELATHQHDFSEEIEEATYLASAATCTEDAKYYYVCAKEGCSSVGTTTWTKTGSALGHDTETKHDTTQHWEECVRENCDYSTTKENHKGGTATQTEKAVCSVCNTPYGELATHAHNFTKQVEDAAYLASAATCTEDAKYYHVCAEEGCISVGTTTWTKTGSALGHADANELSYKTDEAGHWKECSCGHVVVEKENHKDGEATCATYAKCSVCEESYGELDEDNHDWDEWSKPTLAGVSTRVCKNDDSHTEINDKCFGTEENPLTVAEIIEAMAGFKSGNDSGNVKGYVKGYVTNVSYSLQHNSWTIDIVDDLSALNPVKFQLYGCNDPAKKGDYVEASGQLKLFNTTYEFNIDCVIYNAEHNGTSSVTSKVIDGEGNDSTNATISGIPTEVVECCSEVTFTVTVDQGYDVVVKVDGNVVTGKNNEYSFYAYKDIEVEVVVSIVWTQSTDGYYHVRTYLDGEGQTVEFRELHDDGTEANEGVRTCAICNSRYGEVNSSSGEGTETTTTITFDANKTNRTEFDAQKQVWSLDDVTFINEKSKSTNDVGDYGNPVRLYQGSSISISSANNITQILIVSDGTAKYKSALEGSLDKINADYSNSGNNYTIVLSEPTTLFVIDELTAQCRFKSISVSTVPAGSGESHEHDYTLYVTDATHHAKVCSVCGDMSKKVLHTGDTETNNEYKTCEECNVTYGDKLVHIHSYGSEVTEPTCTEDGYTTYTCSCGDTYVADPTSKKGHTEVEIKAEAPTCTEDGTTAGTKCSVCNTVLVAPQVDPALGHSYSTPNYDNDNHWNECSCGAKENVEAHSHAYAYINDNGTLKYVGTCECGHIVSEEVEEEKEVEVSKETDLRNVLASGHNAKLMSDIALTSSIVLDGELDVTIDLNGNSLTLHREEPELNERVEVFLVKNNAKLTIEGEGSVSATVSEDTEVSCYVEVLSAIDGAKVTIKGGSYYSNGCTAIYATRGAIIDIYDGTFEASEKWNGSLFTLDVNEGETNIGIINVYGGTYVNFDPANHTNDGAYSNKVVEGYCSVKVENNYVVDAHVVVTDKAVEETCTTDGKTEGSHCSRCNHVFVAQTVINAKGHNFDVEWSLTKEEHWKDCINGCGAKDSLGVHVEGTPATTEHGAICSVCEQEYTDEINHTHSYDSMGYDETNHWNECSCEDKQNIETHAYTNAYVNDEGTLYYVKSCECGYKVPEEVEEKEVEVSTANDLIAVLSSGHNAKLGASIALDGAIVISNKVEVNLNNMSLTLTEKDTEGDGVFCVVENGHLTINGEGTVNGVGNNTYNMALYAKGGTIVINGGTYTNVGCQENDPGSDHFDLIYVKHGGHVEINDGTFINETPVWTLNSHDTKKGTFTVKGGKFFEYNPADNTTENPTQVWVEEGYHAEEAGDYYEVVACEKGEAKLVSEGTKLYEVEACECGYEFSRVEITEETVEVSTANDLIAVLSSGHNAKLGASIALDGAIVIEKEVEVNLNDKSLTLTEKDTEGNGVFWVKQGATLTLTGNGTVNGKGASEYCMAVWADGGKVIINGGTYTNLGCQENDPGSTQFDLIYVKNGGEVIINGGTFEAEHPKWTLNSHDTKKGTFIVKGGKFLGYNPADNTTENPTKVWVEEGYCSVEVEDYYVVDSHVVVTDKAVEETCTTTGLTEGSHCSRCNHVFVAQTVIVAKGHNYERTVVAPTCTADGYTTHTCTGCNDTYTDTPVAATGHNMSEFSVTLDPTCAEAGEKTSTCANGCGHSVTASIDATGEHEYSNNWTNSKDGKSHVKACVECGDVKETELHYGGTPTEAKKPICKICTLEYGEKIPASKTTTIVIEDYAVSKNWSNGTKYPTISSGNIEITANGGGNTGKFYTNGNNWRIYQGESGTVKVAISNNNVLVSIKITYTISSSGILTYNASQIKSGTEIDVSGTEVTFGVGNTGTATNGQVRITKIEVKYRSASSNVCAHTNVTENVKNSDGSTHSKICSNTNCNSVISTTHCEVTNEATCMNPGTCSCGRVLTSVLDHTFATDWTTDSEYHWKKCTTEGCTAIHSKEVHSGGTATETAKAICSTCHVEYGNLVHTHTYVENAKSQYLFKSATCTTNAKFYTSCSSCGESSKGTEYETIFEQKNSYLDHATANELDWESDDNQHWKKCVCGYIVVAKSDHTGGNASSTVQAKCEVCGTAYGKLAESKTIVFNLGANGSSTHKDGSSEKTTYSETNQGYTLSITGGSKMYPSSIDAKGNGCIKFGTGKAAGQMTITVPEGVGKVIISVAGYKEETAKIKINGSTTTISTISNNGAYTDIEVDTTTNQTITFATVSGGYRCMVNSITFIA